MSHAGQFRQYAEERNSLGRQISSPRSPPQASPKASEYHLIDLATGLSHGGFKTLTGARQHAREKDLPAWDIFHGNVRVEYHDPLGSTLFTLAKGTGINSG